METDLALDSLVLRIHANATITVNFRSGVWELLVAKLQQLLCENYKYTYIPVNGDTVTQQTHSISYFINQ